MAENIIRDHIKWLLLYLNHKEKSTCKVSFINYFGLNLIVKIMLLTNNSSTVILNKNEFWQVRLMIRKRKNNNCETLSYQFYLKNWFSKIPRFLFFHPAMKIFMIIIYNYKIISWKRNVKSVFLKNLEITNASIIVWPPAIDILSSRIHFAFAWPNN